jgi:hypothetical protein
MKELSTGKKANPKLVEERQSLSALQAYVSFTKLKCTADRNLMLADALRCAFF